MRWPDHAVTRAPCSVRWTGRIEPRFTEEYTFSVYSQHGRARVWIGDRLIIDNARLTGTARERERVAEGRWKEFSHPVALQAGYEVPLRIEWEGDPSRGGEFHLNWESASQAIEHVPSTCLYPESVSTALKSSEP